MYLERKQDLSVYYWVKDTFEDAPFLTFVDGFPTDELVVPTISIEAGMLNKRAFELGNRHGLESRVWYIDVFGKNKSQRDEFGYRIINELENKIPVYDYDEGQPPAVSPTKIGVLDPTEIRMDIIKVVPELVTVLYWRSTISFMATYSQI